MDHFSGIRQKLDEYGLDAVMLTEEYNRFYAAGFPSSGTDGLALVTKNANYYFTDSRYTVAALQSVKNAQIEITGRGRGYAELVNGVIEKEGLHTVGFDQDYMTVADYERYSAKLGCALRGASALLRELRTVKDEQELERMVAAQRVAEKALEEILGFIRPGVTERQAAARLQYLMLSMGAEKMSFDPIVVSGIKTTMPHGVPGDKVIEPGDFVTMDFGCVKDGYCSDMTRTVAVGYADAEMRRVYDTVLSAQRAGIAATRAGVTGRDVDAAARQVIEDAGYGEYFGHSYGHGLGIEIHEAPNASPSNDTPLPAGAVTSAEPGIYIPGKFGVRIEDVVIIREGGCEDITLAPKELLVL